MGAAECVHLEDASDRIHEAKAAGMQAVGIGDASGYDKADHKIRSFEELLEIAGI